MKFKLREEKRKFKIYNNGEKDIRVYDGDEPPEGFVPGSHYQKIPWNKGLTSETDDRVKLNGQHTKMTREQNGTYQAWNKGLTAETDDRVAKNVQHMQQTIKDKYGVENISQYLSKQDDYQIWNKGLTKETDDSMRQASEHHKGVTPWNKGLQIGSFWTSESANKRYETQKKNGTLGINQDTKIELEYFDILKKEFPDSEIIHPYIDKNRYPFKCDFYVVDADLFVEVHGNWTHGGRPYDPSDKFCQEQLSKWQEKSKTSDYYKNAIYTWTDLDVRKKNIAEQNNLNFRIIYGI